MDLGENHGNCVLAYIRRVWRNTNEHMDLRENRSWQLCLGKSGESEETRQWAHGSRRESWQLCACVNRGSLKKRTFERMDMGDWIMTTVCSRTSRKYEESHQRAHGSRREPGQLCASVHTSGESVKKHASEHKRESWPSRVHMYTKRNTALLLCW